MQFSGTGYLPDMMQTNVQNIDIWILTTFVHACYLIAQMTWDVGFCPRTMGALCPRSTPGHRLLCSLRPLVSLLQEWRP